MTYSIEVTSNPLNKRCRVEDGVGLVDGEFEINISINCLKELRIGGNLNGLEIGKIILRLNSGEDIEDLELSASKSPISFNFNSLSLDTDSYEVSILSYPKSPYQRCSINNSKGSLNNVDVKNVSINCQFTLYFSGNDGVVGQELFVTDGTPDGTLLVKDINTNTNANPREVVVMAGSIYFVATNGIIGSELWKTNGTSIELVKDINKPNPGSGDLGFHLSDLTVVGNTTLYFAADDGINGVELWKSDGTTVGTVLVKDINPTSASGSYPMYLTELDNRMLYFTASDDVNHGLWKSDGSTSGTVLVKTFNDNISTLMSINNTLYFRAKDNINGEELWKSDGSTAGTVLVKDINPGPANSGISRIFSIGNTLYFRANDGTNGSELWKSDGSAAGTVLVKDINPNPGADSFPNSFVTMGNFIYFAANDGTNGTGMWKSDGTATGTKSVKNIGFNSSKVLNDTLYLSAKITNGGGIGLWKSDGTTTGTELVKEFKINPSLSSSNSRFIPDGNTLYFSADDGTNGNELWKSDGTTVGTLLVKDINLGKGSSNPADIISIFGVTYFAAYDGINGKELWRTDGTTDGTYLIEDLGKVGGSSNPQEIVTIGNISYFSATDGARTSQALWPADFKLVVAKSYIMPPCFPQQLYVSFPG